MMMDEVDMMMTKTDTQEKGLELGIAGWSRENLPLTCFTQIHEKLLDSTEHEAIWC